MKKNTQCPFFFAILMSFLVLFLGSCDIVDGTDSSATESSSSDSSSSDSSSSDSSSSDGSSSTVTIYEASGSDLTVTMAYNGGDWGSNQQEEVYLSNTIDLAVDDVFHVVMEGTTDNAIAGFQAVLINQGSDWSTWVASTSYTSLSDDIAAGGTIAVAADFTVTTAVASGDNLQFVFMGNDGASEGSSTTLTLTKFTVTTTE